MALSAEQRAEMRAQALAHNKEVAQRLGPAVEALAERIHECIVIADELMISENDEWLRIRDTLIQGGANFKVNLDHGVRTPISQHFSNPGAQTAGGGE